MHYCYIKYSYLCYSKFLYTCLPSIRYYSFNAFNSRTSDHPPSLPEKYKQIFNTPGHHRKYMFVDPPKCNKKLCIKLTLT